MRDSNLGCGRRRLSRDVTWDGLTEDRELLQLRRNDGRELLQPRRNDGTELPQLRRDTGGVLYWQETAAWPRRDGGRVLPQLRRGDRRECVTSVEE